MITIPRYSVVDIDNKKSNRKGIKDHQNGKIVVIVKDIIDEQTTQSIAENIISVIENAVGDENGSQD